MGTVIVWLTVIAVIIMAVIFIFTKKEDKDLKIDPKNFEPGPEKRHNLPKE